MADTTVNFKLTDDDLRLLRLIIDRTEWGPLTPRQLQQLQRLQTRLTMAHAALIASPIE